MELSEEEIKRIAQLTRHDVTVVRKCLADPNKCEIPTQERVADAIEAIKRERAQPVLAVACYRAYVTAVGGLTSAGVPFPSFEALQPKQQKAWKAVSETVARSAGDPL